MSRVGSRAVVIEDAIKVTQEGALLRVEGPRGKFSRHIDRCLDVRITDREIVIERKDDTRRSRSIHGLTRSLVQNMVTGVGKGFRRELEFTGVGYRVSVSGSDVIFNLGYSHSIMYELPEGVTCKVERNKIVLESADKQVLGDVAASVRSFRGPEPYKGKGIKYAGERIKRKEGKKIVS